MLLASLAVTTLSLGVLAESGACPAGLSGTAYEKENSCYEFVDDAETWVGARSYCHSHGGRLALITSANLQSWISSRVEALFDDFDEVWIGLNDMQTEGSFVWDNYDGFEELPGAYTNWNSGQPDGLFLNDCAFMRRSHDWRWGDGQCNIPLFRWYAFICEYRIVPSSTPLSTIIIQLLSDNFETTAALSGEDGTITSAAEPLTNILSTTSPSTIIIPPLSDNVETSAAPLGEDDIRLTVAEPLTNILSTTGAAATAEREQPSFLFNLSTTTIPLTTNVTDIESAIDRVDDAEVMYTTTVKSNTYELGSSVTTSDGNLPANATEAERNSSIRETEATTAFLGQSSNRNEGVNAAVLNYSTTRDIKSDTGRVTETVTPPYGANKTNRLGEHESGPTASVENASNTVTALSPEIVQLMGSDVVTDSDPSGMSSISLSMTTVLSSSLHNFSTTHVSRPVNSAESISATETPSATARVTTGSSHDHVPAILITTSTKDSLTKSVPALERTSQGGIILGTMIEYTTTVKSNTYELGSSVTAAESNLPASATEVERSNSIREIEATTAFVGQSSDHNETVNAAVLTYSTIRDIKSDTGREAETLMQPNGTKKTNQLGKLETGSIASEENASNTGMTVYLSVLAVPLLVLVITIALLVIKRYRRRHTRPIAGISNPLCEAA